MRTARWTRCATACELDASNAAAHWHLAELFHANAAIASANLNIASAAVADTPAARRDTNYDGKVSSEAAAELASTTAAVFDYAVEWGWKDFPFYSRALLHFSGIHFFGGCRT